jgi:mono/diheme cytochrome c family protein
MARQTLTTGLLTLGFIAFSGAVTWQAVNAAPAPPPQTVAVDAAAIERGSYLVRTMGCHDCHTPWTMGERGPEPDMSRALTGHPADMVMPPPPALPPGPWLWMGAATNTAFAGPWGVSFTANLTPDKETGLGNWTVDTFIAMLKTGRHEGKGRPVLPPMPVLVYSQLTDEDMRALFAYLQSLPPVHNRVPQPIDPPEPGQ